MMNRETWKAFYRLQRIINRELRKAEKDALLFGTGFIRVEDGFINHILYESVYNE